MTFTLSQACVILVIGLVFGFLIGVVTEVCYSMRKRESQREDSKFTEIEKAALKDIRERSLLNHLSAGDRIWWNG